MKIVLLIRRDKNYWFYNKLALAGIAATQYKYKIFFIKMLWNASFKMKYMDFRKRLRDIAFLTFEKNNFDDILMYFNENHIASLDSGTLIIPIDEDDWFSSDLVKNLRRITDPFKKIYWDIYRKSISGQFYKKRHYYDVESCCYGAIFPCDMNIIKYHVNFKKEGAYYLPIKMAIKMETISSLSAFIWRYEADINNFRKDIYTNAVADINSSIIFPEEYLKEVVLYKDLLKEFLESAIFNTEF